MVKAQLGCTHHLSECLGWSPSSTLTSASYQHTFQQETGEDSRMWVTATRVWGLLWVPGSWLWAGPAPALVIFGSDYPSIITFFKWNHQHMSCPGSTSSSTSYWWVSGRQQMTAQAYGPWHPRGRLQSEFLAPKHLGSQSADGRSLYFKWIKSNQLKIKDSASFPGTF